MTETFAIQGTESEAAIASAIAPLSGPPPPPPLLTAIDISNYDPESEVPALLAQYEPDIVLVRYPVADDQESSSISIAQTTTAIAAGCTVLVYYPCYAGNDPNADVAYVLGIAQQCGFTPQVIFPDIEPSNGSMPDATEIAAIGAAQVAAGLAQPGVYSSVSVWESIGNPSLDATWLAWVADYDDVPLLNVPSFGGATLCGKQFTSDPIDQSVFDPSLITVS